jgi:hypothetical protein
LHASHVKALAAADILARNHVVFADHIRLGFREAGAVALVGVAR